MVLDRLGCDETPFFTTLTAEERVTLRKPLSKEVSAPKKEPSAMVRNGFRALFPFTQSDVLSRQGRRSPLGTNLDHRFP